MPSIRRWGTTALTIRTPIGVALHQNHRRRVSSSSKRCFSGREFYTRAEVIKLHANALGGVHFDFQRTQDEAHTIEVEHYLGFELKGSTVQMLTGREISEGHADPAKRPQVYNATEVNP